MPHALNTAVLETEGYFIPSLPKTAQMSNDRLNILLIEDVASDALMTRITLDATKVPFLLSKMHRGDEVLSRLSISQKLCPMELPDLLLLDLGLPGMDGFEVLAELAQMSGAIRSIPIVILTGHGHFEYVRSTYPFLHIVGYLQKPCHVEDMSRILTKVRRERERFPTIH